MSSLCVYLKLINDFFEEIIGVKTFGFLISNLIEWILYKGITLQEFGDDIYNIINYAYCIQLHGSPGSLFTNTE